MSKRLMQGLLSRSLLVLTALSTSCSLSSTANAQQAEQSEQSSDEEDAEEEKLPPLFSLGNFHISDLRQTRNETVDVRFELYLVLPSDTSEQMLERLVHYRNRLRDRVIVAVRLTETIDFVEADLKRLRQIMRIRIDRELGLGVIDDIYVNNFAFGDY